MAENQEESEQEKIINSLISGDLTDLTGLDSQSLSQYNCEDILAESQKLLNNTNIDELINTTKTETKEKKPEKKNSVTLNTSNDKNVIEVNEIPFKSLSDPIDFVNYIEYQLPKEKTKIKENTFVLKKYEINEKIKFEISEMLPQKELSEKIYRNDLDVTAAIAYEDNFITGDIMGQIKFFSLKDKKLIKTIQCPLKKGNSPISAIEISEEGDFAFAGFNNGNVAMYDLTSNKCKLIIYDAHKSVCINIKFLNRTEKKLFKIFSSDEEGLVRVITIKSGIFGYSVASIENINNKKGYPTFLILSTKFKENEIKAKNALKRIYKMGILANLEEIQLITTEPKLKKIFILKRPEYITDFSVPDVAFGLGKQPTSSEGDEDDVELQFIMLVSWEKVVYLYVMPILNKEISMPILIGNFVNDCHIIKVGFLTISTVYLVDKKYNFKILNTRKFNMGDIELTSDIPSPKVKENNHLAILQKDIHFDFDIIKQMNLKTPQGSVKETYLNSIISNFTRDDVCVLTKKCLYNEQLIDYQRCLKDLQKKGNWMELLILGMSIYQGKMTALSGIPLKSSDRKKIVGEYLQNLISQFLFTNTGNSQISNNKNNYFDPSIENAKIEKNMEITIEFCIEINSVDYLLDKILKIYESKGYRDIFLQKLEPFILCNKMIKFEISEEILLDIIKIYESKKQLDSLSQLLLHINIKSLDIPSVKQKIENLLLTTPLIYLYVNGKEEDYFLPVTKIYEKFLNAKEISGFTTYENLLKQQNITLVEIRESKQYVGHNLLWYITKSLTGKKFPYYYENMDTDIFHKAVSKITYWLISESVMQNLIVFDYKSYFNILTKIFTKEEFIDLLDDNNNDDEILKMALEFLNKETNSYKYKDISPSNLVNYLIELGKKYGSQSSIIYLYLCEFIVKIAKKMNLEKSTKLESTKYIIQSYQNVDNDENKFKNLVKSIIDVIDDMEFTEDDYKNILSIMQNHKFDEVKLFILKKIKDYQESLELFLDKECDIPEKGDKLFAFINMTLTSLKLKTGKDQAIFQNFKKIIMSNLTRIGEISIPNLYNLINTWYTKDKKEVFQKLAEKPTIQLEYVELLIDKFISNSRQTEDMVIDEDAKIVDYIFSLHIKLLCELGQTEKILPSLKKCSFYPVQTCLEFCIYYKVNDACIYLYQLQGDADKALQICLTVMNSIYVLIVNNLQATPFNENTHNLEMMEFSKNFSQSVEVCEQNEKALVENHEPWFSLLNNLYYFEDYNNQKLVPAFSQTDRIKYVSDIKELISNKLKNLIEKMSYYVGVLKIIEIVCAKNKNAEFREFKPLLLKMLSSFGTQANILKCLSNLITDGCFEDQDILQKLNTKGRDLNLDCCDVCKRSFNQTLEDRDKFLVFKCDHIEHEYCAIKDENDAYKKVCPICKKIEVENSITDNTKNITTEEMDKILVDNKKKLAPEKKRDINLFSYKRGFARMKAIDNYSTDKRKLFYYDSANSCRDKYRKKVFD